MKRLTSKRTWEEASQDLRNEFGYSHVWNRLNIIEDILGDEYSLSVLDHIINASAVIDTHGLKIGDRVFDISSGKTVEEWEVVGFSIGDCSENVESTDIYRGSVVVYGKSVGSEGERSKIEFPVYEIGEIVFLNRKVAESVLKCENKWADKLVTEADVKAALEMK